MTQSLMAFGARFAEEPAHLDAESLSATLSFLVNALEQVELPRECEPWERAFAPRFHPGSGGVHVGATANVRTAQSVEAVSLNMVATAGMEAGQSTLGLHLDFLANSGHWTSESQVLLGPTLHSLENAVRSVAEVDPAQPDDDFFGFMLGTWLGDIGYGTDRLGALNDRANEYVDDV
jgi:hypothetical protein